MMSARNQCEHENAVFDWSDYKEERLIQRDNILCERLSSLPLISIVYFYSNNPTTVMVVRGTFYNFLITTKTSSLPNSIHNQRISAIYSFNKPTVK